jgi:hypothetical protein
MKKNESKKLTLSRETVGTLDGYLQDVKGGAAVGIVSSDDRACTYSRNCPVQQYPVATGFNG